jgi:hypothetical protein
MNLQKKFTDQQLEAVVEEATIYMCACPAQVAEQIRQLRRMIRYQKDCETQQDTDSRVHRAIAQAGLQAHNILETCMDEILDIEGWDRNTLRMPAGLRQLRDALVAGS